MKYYVVSLLLFFMKNAYSLGATGFFMLSYKPPMIDFNENKKIYMIDIDGTICSKTNSEYKKCLPFKEQINKFNKLYDDGHEINYWTARGANSGKNWDFFTVKQLNKWGVKYHTINRGKPHYDVWIDDKAINSNYFMN